MDIKNILQIKDVKYIENNGNYIFNQCPVCNGVHKLYLSKKDYRWICFKCIGDSNTDKKTDKNKGKGNLYSILRLIGFSHFEVIEIIGGKNYSYIDDFKFEPITTDKSMGSSDTVKEIILPWHFEKLDGTKENITKYEDAYKYLLSRNVNNVNIIKKFDLHYSDKSKRIFFPIRKNYHTIVGYQGRDITNRNKTKHYKCVNPKCEMRHYPYFSGEHSAPEFCPICNNKLELWHYPKMLNSKDFPKKNIFMNEHIIDWDKPICLVEGPFDSINTPNSLPLLGKFLSKYQFNILYNNCKELVLSLDGDQYGVAATQEIYNELSPFIKKIRVVDFEPNEDPGQFNFEENLKRVKESIDYVEWALKKNIFSLYI